MKAAQEGFALIAAIVLVAVLAALAGFVASMVGGQSAGAQLERLSQTVERAAQSGVEWGGHRVMRSMPLAVCPAAVVLPALAAYPGVSIAVSCTATVTSEPPIAGPGAVTVYRVTATATYGLTPANADYVQRTRVARFSR